MQHVQTMQLLAKEPVSVPVATQKHLYVDTYSFHA